MSEKIYNLIMVLLLLYSIGVTISHANLQGKVKNYKGYVKCSEALIDSVYVKYDTFADTIMENDVYDNYCHAYFLIEE